MKEGGTPGGARGGEIRNVSEFGTAKFGAANLWRQLGHATVKFGTGVQEGGAVEGPGKEDEGR